MPMRGKLLAWIERRSDNAFLVSLVGGAAPQREPAKRLCNSPDQARQWVEEQAAALDLPIEWLPGDRRRSPRSP